MVEEENKFTLQCSGTMDVTGKETHPAWLVYKSFAFKVGCSFAGTEWVIPWLYFKAGWELKEVKDGNTGK